VKYTEKAGTGWTVARAKMSLETMLMLGMLKTFRKRGDEGSTVALLNWVVHDIEPPILRSGVIWTFYDEGSGPTLGGAP